MDEYIPLGTYADEDRAKLVLRKIVACYSSYQATEAGLPYCFTPPKVFEMPGAKNKRRTVSGAPWELLASH